MTKDSKRKEKDSVEKPTILKTDDELMDDLFDPEVRKKLKEEAHKHRPKENEDD